MTNRSADHQFVAHVDLSDRTARWQVTLRRASHFYVKFGVLPQILMTMVGFVAHAFRGHRAGSVTFISGTGFTVALALTAHAVFFVDKLPVVRSWTFMEFCFLWSFILSLLATCFSLYLYKKTEHYEEHLSGEEEVKMRGLRSWEALPDSKRRSVRIFFWVDQGCVPLLTITYTLGLLTVAVSKDANIADGEAFFRNSNVVALRFLTNIDLNRILARDPRHACVRRHCDFCIMLRRVEIE